MKITPEQIEICEKYDWAVHTEDGDVWIEVQDACSILVGDIISFELTDGEAVEAMAVKKDDQNTIFCLVDCLRDEYKMNSRNTNKGGYEASELRAKLNVEILARFPTEITEMMVPFANGDLLRLPTEKEIFGVNSYGLDEPEDVTQWKPMKLRRNRIAFQGLNGSWEWYWLQNPALRDVASSTHFALVTGNGHAAANSASDSIGVRPAFQIRNL